MKSFIYLIALFLSAFILTACNRNNTQSGELADNMPQIVNINLEECLNTPGGARQIEIDTCKIFALKNSETFSDGYRIEEIYGDTMVVISNTVANVYKLPDCELLESVSRQGTGEDEYKRIGDATLPVSGERGVIITAGYWLTDDETIRHYDSDNNMTCSIDTKLYGDIRKESDSIYIATNWLGFAGGQRKLYRLDSRFERIDSVNLPEYMEPQEAYFYLDCPIKYDGESLYVFLNDTIYTLSENYDAIPRIAIDYGSKHMPDTIVAKRFRTREEFREAQKPYIDLKYIDKCGDYLISTYVYNNNTYKTIFDAESGDVVWTNKSEGDSGYGIEWNINGVTVSAVPHITWNGNLVLELEAEDMSRIYGKPTENAGVALLPLDTLKSKFPKS